MFALLGVLAAVSAVGATPLRRVETQQPVVVLTFDACATPKHGFRFDRPVFEALQADQIPATIFVSGRWVETHPAETKEIAAEPLLEFGNHTWDHPHLQQISEKKILDEVRRTEEILDRTVGKKSVAVRPPYGHWSRRVVQTIRTTGLPFVTWDVATGDPSKRATVKGIVRTVLRDTRPGSIIIFHINGNGHGTAGAVPIVARELRARGLRLVKLSELLALAAEPTTPEAAAPANPAPAPAPATAPVAPLPIDGGAPAEPTRNDAPGPDTNR